MLASMASGVMAIAAGVAMLKAALPCQPGWAGSASSSAFSVCSLSATSSPYRPLECGRFIVVGVVWFPQRSRRNACRAEQRARCSVR